MRKRIIPVTLIVLSVILVAAGIWRDEVREVVSNATILCFSCIGLK